MAIAKDEVRRLAIIAGSSYDAKLRRSNWLLEKNTNLYTGCLVCDYIDSFLARAIYMTNFDVPADSMVQYGGSW